MVCAFLAKGSRPSLQAGVEKIAFIVLSTVIVYLMMQTCFQSAAYGGLARGLAATITTTLMAPCSDKPLDDVAFAGKYKGIVYSIIGIGVMFTLDMALSSKASSVAARECVLASIE